MRSAFRAMSMRLRAGGGVRARLSVLALAAAVLTALIAWHPAAAEPPETLRYSPATCSDSADGRIFIRLLSGLHFAFPYKDVKGLRWDGEDRPDLPADESEPLGCPRNPAVAGSVRLAWRPDWDGPAPDPDWPAIRLNVIHHDGPLGLHEDLIYLAEKWTDRFVKLSDELEVHRGRPAPSGTSVDGLALIVARPGAYPLAMGRRVAVRCLPAIRPGSPKNCRFDYGLTDGLSVDYQFAGVPEGSAPSPWTDGHVAEIDVLDFDRHIRRYLAAHQLSEDECRSFGICGETRWQPPNL